MTEQEWTIESDVSQMCAVVSLPLTDRRLRLLAIACARKALDVYFDPLNPRTIVNPRRFGYDDLLFQSLDTAEKFADGMVSANELSRSREWTWNTYWEDIQEHIAICSAYRCCVWDGNFRDILWDAVKAMADIVGNEVVAAIIREVVGNPYRPVFAGDASLLNGNELVRPVWFTSPVVHMAQVIYDDRDWDALPMLADRLEDSGCPDGDLLRHLRGEERCSECRGHGFLPFPHGISIRECPTCEGDRWVPLRGPHVRGCWALDHVRGVS